MLIFRAPRGPPGRAPPPCVSVDYFVRARVVNFGLAGA
jgi:hypothetical protein